MKNLQPRIFLKGLRDDESGATLLEMALLLPMFMSVLFGTMDVGHNYYMRSVLDGAVQDLARDSALEDGGVEAKQKIMDDYVRNQVQGANAAIKDSDIVIKRRFYRTFSKAAAAQAEPFTDTNNNGTCDTGEPFVDKNNNGNWDSDGGDSGQGGAKDVSVVTATVSYKRLFPVMVLLGEPWKITLSSTTVLANQPYGAQNQYTASTVENCP